MDGSDVVMSTVRAMGGVDIQATASPSVAQGSALGTKLSSRLDQFTQGQDK